MDTCCIQYNRKLNEERAASIRQYLDHELSYTELLLQPYRCMMQQLTGFGAYMLIHIQPVEYKIQRFRRVISVIQIDETIGMMTLGYAHKRALLDLDGMRYTRGGRNRDLESTE